ncbi:hypothetical protein N9I06_01155 [Gammaproteobacteria bacterium]|nr:hypothetical protein [Gammaproteobacteria bacterium]MDA9815285.1 hypothetical protein [Gammaproteobacteria bacterium]
MKKFKTIYFIYDADGGLWNEIKYWYKKNIKKERSPCELCDISHSKYFVRLEWLQFIRELKREYKVRVLHRNEIPKNIQEKNYALPCVIGETFENEFKEIMDKISFIDWGKPTNVRELKEYFSQVME